jgi:hypothetical protein
MLSTARSRPVTAPALPAPRGPLCVAVLEVLRGSAAAPSITEIGSAAVEQADPYGEDLQLALYCCYELHYWGFAGVGDGLERTRDCSGCAGSWKKPSSPRCGLRSGAGPTSPPRSTRC